MCDDTPVSETIIKVIMCAGDIPDGSVITKRTGQKEYLIKDKIRVFPDKNSDTQAITLETPGVKYLTANDGNINAIAHDTELVWVTTAEDLYYHLGNLVDPPEYK